MLQEVIELLKLTDLNLSGMLMKRLFDISLAALLLLLLMPVMLVVAVMVVLIDRQLPLFRQYRVGKEGHLFRMFKFRTMRAGDAGHTGNERNPVFSPDQPQKRGVDSRVTGLGKVLRRGVAQREGDW